MAEKEKKTAVEVGAELAKEIVKPVYEDAVQPAAKELGKAGHLAGRMLNLALGPVELVVLAGEGVLDLARKKLSSKLAGYAESELQNPDPIVVIPALEGLRRAVDHEELQEMYLNLIANASLKSGPQVHPRFVDAISKMSPAEATLFGSLGQSAESVVWVNIAVSYGAGDPKDTVVFSPLEVPEWVDTPETLASLGSVGLIQIINNLVEGAFATDNVTVFHEDEKLREWREGFKHILTTTIRNQLTYADGGRYKGKVRTARLTTFGYDFYRAAIGIPAGRRPSTWGE